MTTTKRPAGALLATTLTTTLATVTLALLTAGTTPAYAVPDPQPVRPFVPGINEDPQLSRQWQRWQAKDIHDYVITVRVSCFCNPTPAVRTVVRDDETVRVTQGGRRLGLKRGYSMDEMYTRIREAMASADDVSVDYAARGVPSSITIDRIANAADDELYYTVELEKR